MGGNFCNGLSNELYKLLQIKHTTTSPYWPQCNSQAEVANKTIQKYLASFVDETTLDWPLYMAPKAFAYNTSLHRSIKSTPYFLTFGQEPLTRVSQILTCRGIMVNQMQHSGTNSYSIVARSRRNITWTRRRGRSLTTIRRLGHTISHPGFQSGSMNKTFWARTANCLPIG
jgi:hypothetical protein